MDKKIYTHNLNLANTLIEVNKIVLSQASSFRRCVVLSCVSSCEREACANTEIHVRLRNLRATTPQHIWYSLPHPSISDAVGHTWLQTPLGKTACTCNFETPPHRHRHRGLTCCSQLDVVNLSASSTLAWPVPRRSSAKFWANLFLRGGRVVQPEVHENVT